MLSEDRGAREAEKTAIAHPYGVLNLSEGNAERLTLLQ